MIFHESQGEKVGFIGQRQAVSEWRGSNSVSELSKGTHPKVMRWKPEIHIGNISNNEWF
jgi:hypothetical protein